jgi:hypothetical protein
MWNIPPHCTLLESHSAAYIDGATPERDGAMFWNLTTVIVVVLTATVLCWLGPKFVAAFKHFDDENRARIAGEAQDRRDSSAHIRHTLKIAEEQVEDILEIMVPDPRTGTPAARFVFEGEEYFSRADAEKVRAQKIGDIARGFYRELPAALTARKQDGRLG